MPPTTDRPRLLMCIHGGGFVTESAMIARGIGDAVDLVYAIVRDEVSLEGLPVPNGPVVHLSAIRTWGSRSPLRLIRGITANVRTIRAAIRTHGCDAVLTVGSNLALPCFLAARLTGRKTVFVESLARIDRLSRTARLCLALRLIDRFYVPWPELVRHSKRALYKGTVV